jgi:DNA replication initiation complex subunit (GINS family)
MISYNDLYEILRKEKYGENLQPISKKFISEFNEMLKEKKETSSLNNDLFSDSVLKSKKQLENSVGLFKEIILRRKKKLLNLAFVATETGIMKRDYENMLDIEKEMFEKLVKAFEDEDKQIANTLNSREEKVDSNKMVIFKKEVQQFVDSRGNLVGPFKSGELANLNVEISKILVEDEKAQFVDEN